MNEDENPFDKVKKGFKETAEGVKEVVGGTAEVVEGTAEGVKEGVEETAEGVEEGVEETARESTDTYTKLYEQDPKIAEGPASTDSAEAKEKDRKKRMTET